MQKMGQRDKFQSSFFFKKKKGLIWGKSKWYAAEFQYILIALNLEPNQNKLYKTLDIWSSDMFNFDFFFRKKGLGIVSPPHFVYDFSRKMFVMLHCFNWLDSILWLPLILKKSGKVCIAIICFPGIDVINSEINLVFLIKLFLYMTKKSRQTFKYRGKKKRF